jgi:hypothetical protein
LHALAAIVPAPAVQEVTALVAEGVDDIAMDPVLNAVAFSSKRQKSIYFHLMRLPVAGIPKKSQEWVASTVL